jgi:hypothetical protein
MRGEAYTVAGARSHELASARAPGLPMRDEPHRGKERGCWGEGGYKELDVKGNEKRGGKPKQKGRLTRFLLSPYIQRPWEGGDKRSAVKAIEGYAFAGRGVSGCRTSVNEGDSATV